MQRNYHLYNGEPEVITVANATGASPYTWTPVSQYIYLVVGIYLDYTTADDSNGDRYPGIKYIKSSNEICWPISSLAQAENEVFPLSAFIGSNLSSSGPNYHRFALPMFFIDSTYSITDGTENRQNADTMQNIRITVLKFRK